MSNFGVGFEGVTWPSNVVSAFSSGVEGPYVSLDMSTASGGGSTVPTSTTAIGAPFPLYLLLNS